MSKRSRSFWWLYSMCRTVMRPQGVPRGWGNPKPGGVASIEGFEPLEPRVLLSATLELSSLLPPTGDGSEGVVIDGIDTLDQLGRSVTSIGDINGDGIADVVISAPVADVGSLTHGQVYVIFGQDTATAGGFPASFDLTTLNGVNGFTITGEGINTDFGFSVDSAGDVNGDGIGDLIIGQPSGTTFNRPGRAVVVLGKQTFDPGGVLVDPFSAVIDLNTTTFVGTDGFEILGDDDDDSFGESVGAAGDINNDGFGDLLIGAPDADPGGLSQAGEAYAIFGNATGFGGSLDLSMTALNGSNGFVINGLNGGDFLGTSVSGAGDIDGDMIDDIIVGAHRAFAGGVRAGQAYVIYGKDVPGGDSFAASITPATDLIGSNGFKIDGGVVDDELGYAVAAAGDLNGDGRDDVAVGARLATAGGVSQAGQTYVVFGRGRSFISRITATALDGTDGVILNGVNVNDQLGTSVGTAGDFNDDGNTDLIIGAPNTNNNTLGPRGQAFVVYGGDLTALDALDGTTDGSLSLSLLDESTGLILNGIAAGDQAGLAVGSAGDFNGDGVADVIVGALSSDVNGDLSGQAYIVFGRSSVTPVAISGRVFDDLDNDGVFDPGDGESGIADVTIGLTGTETDGGVVDRTTTTRSDGTYSFENVLPGDYTLTELGQPNGLLDGNESVGSLGGTVDNTQDSNVIAGLTVDASSADSDGYNFAEIRPSMIQGTVWEDFNNNGLIDFNESAIEAATVNLTGTDDRGNAVSVTGELTDDGGVYVFTGLRPGDYTISADQPSGFEDGVDVVGTVNGVAAGLVSANDTISGIVLPGPDAVGLNYNFGERPEAGAPVSSGQAATVGFWLNKKTGQSLIKSLNGGENDTQLGDWLATAFGNMYGNLAGMTNAEIASYFKDLATHGLQLSPPKPKPKLLEARALSVALSVYVTNEALAGTTAQAYGFTTSQYGLGVSTIDVGDDGEAFGVADGTIMTIMDVLLATNARSSDRLLFDADGSGDIDSDEQADRHQANSVYLNIIDQGL